MKTPVHGAKFPLSAGIAVTLAIGMLAAAQTAYAEGPPAPGLGEAASFAVLAGSGITNTGPSVINGDIGTYPTTTIDGFPPGTVNGTNHGGDGVTQNAKANLVTAYNALAGSGPTLPVAADLGGQTLVPGVYNSASSLGLTGTLTLSGGSTDVWIFQAGSTLTTATGSSVVIIGGATSCNVFWQIGSSATIGKASAFKGTIVALQSITVTTGATIDGRALARNGAVTLDTNVITRSTCAPGGPGGSEEFPPSAPGGPGGSEEFPPHVGNTALSGSEPGAPIGTLLFALVAIGSLGVLVTANVRTARRHK